MKHISTFILSFIILATTTVWANDSEYFVIGNQLVPLQQTSICVTKEILSIDLRDDSTAYVNVYYEFNNPENTPKTIIMGFEADPPYFCEDRIKASPYEHPYIKKFTVDINGQRILHKNAISEVGKFRPINKPINLCIYNDNENAEPIDGNLAYVYYFEATFQPGINKVRHTYRYMLGYSVDILYFLDYKLTPAARWANKQIDDFTLIVSAKQSTKHFFIPTICIPGAKPNITMGVGKTRLIKNDYNDDLEEWEVALRKGAISFHIKNFRPQKELCVHSGRRLHTYDRAYCNVAYYDWTDFTDFQLRIIRNLPYASRGHVFKNQQLKQFFESCFWYIPDPNYKDETSDFTPSEWKCINMKPKNK